MLHGWAVLRRSCRRFPVRTCLVILCLLTLARLRPSGSESAHTPARKALARRSAFLQGFDHIHVCVAGVVQTSQAAINSFEHWGGLFPSTFAILNGLRHSPDSLPLGAHITLLDASAWSVAEAMDQAVRNIERRSSCAYVFGMIYRRGGIVR
jgi:hypothetical protein